MAPINIEDPDAQVPLTGPKRITDELKSNTRLLLEKLEQGDSAGANELIRLISGANDEILYYELGRLTRGLHSAIRDFHLDMGLENDPGIKDEISEMTDASSRLNYVIGLTEQAANRTMDMVDESGSVVSRLAQEAGDLKDEWARLMKREIQLDEFRSLYHRVDVFLDSTAQDGAYLNERFGEILMAQGYQDLSGQTIKRVIELIHEVEASLVRLVRLASNVEDVAGLDKLHADPEVKAAGAMKDDRIRAEGPQFRKETNKAEVVSGQDEVDDLLSSLGF